ncbi:UNKNOWN [Stylonychia lemnae]|uniref:Uncharacterized protein n=1 Tax=Stylonychia lemnae TaxID=5949 RepID=A0A078APQ6_STYLE|nr:UNKNOWN [Stylonychia lemnae]|eukprot:CDW84355.1 UNKNOWN [Stylonychia lemnae]
MIESINADGPLSINKSDNQFINPKLRMSTDGNLNGQIQNPYLVYSKNIAMNKSGDKQQSGSHDFANIQHRNNYDQASAYQEISQVNTSNDGNRFSNQPHSKANSLVLQTQQQLLQKAQNQKGQHYNSEQVSKAYDTSYAAKNLDMTSASIQRHSNGNRTFINTLIHNQNKDNLQVVHLVNNQISHTSIDMQRKTPGLNLNTELVSNQIVGHTQDAVKSNKRKISNGLFQEQLTPLPIIQPQNQNQMMLQQYYQQQQIQAQMHQQQQQQQHQQQQQQAQQMNQTSSSKNGNQSLMQYALQRNHQQKSGALIQISSMPIYLGNQNLFMQSQKIPDSPLRRIPLPDLNQQQLQTNRPSITNGGQYQFQQQQASKQLPQRPIQNTFNGNPTTQHNKKSSSSALSHSPSVRPVKTIINTNNNMVMNSGKVQQASFNGKVVQGSSFKLSQNSKVQQNQQFHISLKQNQITNGFSQGKTLMPKLFDFCMIEDMCIKKQQQNQREIEEALQQLERQKQQKQSVMSVLNKRQ